MARENCQGSLLNEHCKWRDKDPTVKTNQIEKIIGIKYVLYLWFILNIPDKTKECPYILKVKHFETSIWTPNIME